MSVDQLLSQSENQKFKTNELKLKEISSQLRISKQIFKVHIYKIYFLVINPANKPKKQRVANLTDDYAKKLINIANLCNSKKSCEFGALNATLSNFFAS